MNKVPTVSDTKKDFYNHHTRPVNSVYRRVVEELMVEMHLLAVNADFNYDPIYAMGVVTSFERFMQGYQPEKDKESIFEALCKAVGKEQQQYRQDAELLKTMALHLPGKELLSWFASPTPLEETGDLHNTIIAIAQNPKFKYSRLFAVGIYSLLEQANLELVKDEKQLNEALKQISSALHLPEDKLQKDLDLYRSNLEKMEQAQLMMADAIIAERKKREKRTQDKKQGATAANNSPESIQESDSSQGETPSS
ncbi:photosystem II biogenesis protein Psp29 [Lyngbya aestuarii]|uniref:photosystem II biogenesis protein Psp29 n=1 Tax=Lyngbya aestuarii TaxID=118322 RepID=UPI00403DF0DE